MDDMKRLKYIIEYDIISLNNRLNESENKEEEEHEEGIVGILDTFALF